MTLTDEQVSQLLQPIHPSRVLADGKGHAHVSQQRDPAKTAQVRALWKAHRALTKSQEEA